MNFRLGSTHPSLLSRLSGPSPYLIAVGCFIGPSSSIQVASLANKLQGSTCLPTNQPPNPPSNPRPMPSFLWVLGNSDSGSGACLTGTLPGDSCLSRCFSLHSLNFLKLYNYISPFPSLQPLPYTFPLLSLKSWPLSLVLPICNLLSAYNVTCMFMISELTTWYWIPSWRALPRWRPFLLFSAFPVVCNALLRIETPKASPLWC